MKQSSITTELERIEQLLTETDKALTVKDISTHIGQSSSSIGGYLSLMIAFGKVEKRRKGTNFWFLKDKYTEEELNALLPTDKPARRPRKLRYQMVPGRPGRPRKKTASEIFRDGLLSDIDRRASSGGLRALAILGLPDIESVKPRADITKIQELAPTQKALITIRASSTVGELPKNVRRLPQTELKYLKKLLQHYDWYMLIENLHTGYAKFKAIKNGRYGDELYFSKGSNIWDDIIQISLDDSISGTLILPLLETKRWGGWKNFLTPPKFVRPKLGRPKVNYGEMITQFIESGHKLVEITVEDKQPSYVRSLLKTQIELMQLQDQIEISRVEKWIYLERIRGNTDE